MPELPEVETVKRVLKKNLIGLKIESVDINYVKMIKTNVSEFQKNIINQIFIDVKRRGKWLIFELSNYYLVSHLKMEGKYFFSSNYQVRKHDHIIFHLSNNKTLTYNDTRKFGVMYLVKKDKLYIDTPLKDLGLEPFSDDLNVFYLKDKIGNKNTVIKTLLLDQSIITGIGNIYDNEILYASHISPFKKGNELTDLEIQSIIDNTRLILNKAISLGGTTIRSYTSSLGVSGRYQDNLKVHMKETCLTCHGDILNTKIGGRSTYYCPICQGVRI